jgi:Ribosomal protein S24e
LKPLTALLQAELKEKLAKMYDVRDPNTIFVFGFRTQASNTAAPAVTLCEFME